LKSSGIDKPLWNTETGWQIHSNYSPDLTPPNPGHPTLTDAQAIAYVMRTYLLNWACGVSRIYWYDWDGNAMGLGDDLGKQKKPAAEAYTAIREWMVGATVMTCKSDANASWMCELVRQGHNQWIVWNPNGPVLKSAPSSWNIRETVTLSPAGQLLQADLGSNRLIQYSPIPTLLR
jgi:hypothetical protein